jgi:hypothetical protein
VNGLARRPARSRVLAAATRTDAPVVALAFRGASAGASVADPSIDLLFVDGVEPNGEKLFSHDITSLVRHSHLLSACRCRLLLTARRAGQDTRKRVA